MAHRLTYRVLRAAAIGLGTGLTAYSAWLSWSHFGDPTGPIAAVTGAGLFVFGEYAWHGRQRLRAAFLFGLGALALVISGTAVLQRVAATQEARSQGARSDNLPRIEADKALTAAQEALAAAEAVASAECRSGRGARCTGLEEEAARKRVEDARAKLVGLGAHTAEDPGAQHIAAFLPITATQYQLAAPVPLPLWLELTAPLLLSIGLAPRRKAKVKPRRSRTKKKRVPRKPARPYAVVLPLRKAH